MGAAPLAPNKKGSPYNKKASKQIGGLGILRLLLQSIKEKGSFGSYPIHNDLLDLACKRIGTANGRVLGLYVKRRGLENLVIL